MEPTLDSVPAVEANQSFATSSSALCSGTHPIPCSDGTCCPAQTVCGPAGDPNCYSGGGGGGGSCPNSSPINCGNGYCCDTAHPNCGGSVCFANTDSSGHVTDNSGGCQNMAGDASLALLLSCAMIVMLIKKVFA